MYDMDTYHSVEYMTFMAVFNFCGAKISPFKNRLLSWFSWKGEEQEEKFCLKEILN